MRHTRLSLALAAGMLWMAAAAPARGQAAQGARKATTPEVLKATASFTGPGGATLSTPVTITVKRTMSQAEANRYATVFKNGGQAALRKALVDIPTTGTIQLGSGKLVPTRVTTERQTEKGRVLRIITLEPLLFLGASLPDAKPTKGYDFAVIELQLDAAGTGSGTIATAAWIKLDPEGSLVVQDYSGELVKLTVAGK